MDITANLVTTSQLDTWMQAAEQRTLATVDEWCYALNTILSGGIQGGNCPNGNFTGGCNGCNQIDPPGSGLGTGADSVYLACGMLGDGSNRGSLPQVSSTVFLNALRTAQLNASNPLPGGATTPSASGSGAPSPSPTPTPTTTAPAPGLFGMTNCTICQQLAANPVLVLIIVVAGYYFFFEK
jgi:hypothetical protein